MRRNLTALATLAGIAGLCTSALAVDKDRNGSGVLLNQPEGTILSGELYEVVAGGSPIGDEPNFGDRGNDCVGSACQGTVSNFAGAATFRRSDLLVIATTGQQQTWRAADSFSVTTDGDITQLCVMGTYVTPTNAVVVTPVGATWRVRYYPDAGGFPCLVPRAEFTIGATAPTAGTSFSVDAAIDGGLFNRYTFNHPAVPVVAGECLWMEVVDTQGLATAFFAMLTQTPVTDGDDRVASIAVGGANSAATYGPASILAAANNLHFCVNVGTMLDTVTDCPGVGFTPPFNDEISTPTMLTIGDPPTLGTTTNAQQDFIRPCGNTVANAGGVWYRVTGTGTLLTVDVDGSACSDPQVAVYDATAFDGPGGGSDISLICVGDDDDGGPGIASSFTFCSGSGTEYLIFVRPADQTFNNNFAAGPFNIAISSGAACAMPDGGNCDVVSQPGDIAELEFCGTTSNDNCSGSVAATGPAEPYTIGTTVFGTHTTVFAASRSFDTYAFTVSGVAAEFAFTYESAAPILVQFLTCSGTGVAGLFDGQAFVLPACTDGVALQLVFPPNSYAVQFVPIGFGGYDGCATDYINYRFSLVAAATGACCVGDVCSVSTAAACFDANGVFGTEGSDCTASPCAIACDLTIAGTDTIEAETCRGIALSQVAPSVNGTCATAQVLNPAGETIFGNLSTDVEGLPNGVGIRDIDHYSFTLAAASDVTLTLAAEADAEFGILDCPGNTFATAVFTADSCVGASQTVSLPAGDYAVQVRSANFTGLPCTSNQNDYRLVVDFGGDVPCPGDYNDDGQVDLLDLLSFNGEWSGNLGTMVPMGTLGDYDNSGTVDLLDLLAFNGDWSGNLGTPCP